MFKKFFSVVIIPQKTSGVKKIRVATLPFGLGIVVLLCLIIGLAVIAYDYIQRRSRLTGIEEVRMIYLKQKKEIDAFGPRYENIELHFEILEALNHKLRSITSLRKNKNSRLDAEGAQARKEKLEMAAKGNILSVIDSASDKIDSVLLYRQEEKFKSLIRFLAEKRNPLLRVPHGWPVRGFLIDEFGMRGNFSNRLNAQYGINIATRIFHPVYALADGIVILAKKEEIYGNLLVIDHGNGFVSRYGHIARFEVEEGDAVRKNGIIAQAGNTGRAGGPRLYYEITFNGIPQNPVKYIR